jgi:hypothetical protein
LNLKRYQEAHEIADEKVQITEYLQSVLEKYQERVMKELVDFKADLEIDNPGEVDLIEKGLRFWFRGELNYLMGD